MASTGVMLVILVISHVNTSAHHDTDAVIIVGRTTHDSKPLVVDTFQDPVYAFGYAIAMVLLGTHLGHGIWSAFVSLGMSSRKVSAVVYTVGVAAAVLLAIGFLFIPLYIYFGGGCDAALINCN